MHAETLACRPPHCRTAGRWTTWRGTNALKYKEKNVDCVASHVLYLTLLQLSGFSLHLIILCSAEVEVFSEKWIAGRRDLHCICGGIKTRVCLCQIKQVTGIYQRKERILATDVYL